MEFHGRNVYLKKKKKNLHWSINPLRKQTDLKGRHKFRLSFFICGGPCHLSSLKQCLFHWGQLVHPVMETIIFLSLHYHLINTLNIKIMSLISFTKPRRELLSEPKHVRKARRQQFLKLSFNRQQQQQEQEQQQHTKENTTPKLQLILS